MTAKETVSQALSAAERELARQQESAWNATTNQRLGALVAQLKEAKEALASLEESNAE